jgi:hypothetical protein
MDKNLSIVLSPNKRNYREVARNHWGLTLEQMKGMHVHHHPAVSCGGRNIPEHLFVCSPSMHQHGWHNDEFFVLMAGTTSGNKYGERGKPPSKIKCTDRELQIYNLRQTGLSSTKIANLLKISRHQAKRAYAECVKYGLPPLPSPKPGPPKGCKQYGGVPKGYKFTTG